MFEWITENSFFCVFLTLGCFELARAIQRKGKSTLLNPILVGSILVCAVLKLTGMEVKDYQADCAPLQFFLTPATICFSIGLFEQIEKLKKHLPSITIGVFCGTLVSLISIRSMARVFKLDYVLTVSLLPKSITTAIGMVLSQEAGGVAALTTAAIIITGILGNILGPFFCKYFRITEPIAQGAAFGTASHAIGTSKANEISELTGAVSSLSLTLAGLITVALFSFFTT